MKRLLFICTTPRTGSSMLRSDIRSTQAMGDPREWFNLNPGGRFQQEARERGVPSGDLDAYIAALKQNTATENGVVGVKLFELHLRQLVAEGMLPGGPGRLRALAEWFGTPEPVILTLTRNNKLRQAISFRKAKQTRQWGTRGEVKGEAIYDRKGIEAEVIALIERENRWDRELEASGYTPDLRLIYEAFEHEREETLLKVAVALGLPDPERIIAERIPDPDPLERQADHHTEEWVDRFIGWE